MKTTLVILTPGFPADEDDSTCLPPQQVFVRALRRAAPELDLVILSFQYPFSGDPYLWHGVKVIPFNGRNRGKLNRLKVWVKVWAVFSDLRKEHDIAGILSFWCTECALLGKYLGKYYSIRHRCWILGQDAKKENSYVRLMRPEPAELIAMSGFLQREFKSNHGIKPGHIIPNGVDPELFPSGAVERNIDILGVGSLIALKRYDLFIKLTGRLQSRLPALHAMILGKGPEKNKLLAMVERLGLSQQISFEGEQSHSRTLEMMTRAKVLLHTSAYEGFSTVCLEALFAGAHVISFCSPVNGLASHWHIVKNEEEMFNKLAEVLHDQHLDHSSQLVFSMRDSARAMLKLYE